MIALISFTLMWVSMASQTSHPISLALLLLILAMNFGLVIFKAQISWFFYILVLVFLGGVMVVVMYMTSLAANEKLIKPQLKWIFTNGVLIILLVMSYLLPINPKMMGTYKFVGGLYTEMGGGVLIFCALSLLISMLTVVKIIKLESGPLVKKL